MYHVNLKTNQDFLHSKEVCISPNLASLLGEIQNFLLFKILIYVTFKMGHTTRLGRLVGTGEYLEFPGVGDV